MKKYKVGLFPMVADLLHAGHLIALKDAKKQCDKLIVALNVLPDGKRPLETVYERYTRLVSCKYVDEVIPYQGEKDLLLLLKTTEYDVRFTGQDHLQKWSGKEYEQSQNIDHVVINREHGLSSTELKARLKKVD